MGPEESSECGRGQTTNQGSFRLMELVYLLPDPSLLLVCVLELLITKSSFGSPCAQGWALLGVVQDAGAGEVTFFILQSSASGQTRRKDVEFALGLWVWGSMVETESGEALQVSPCILGLQ